MAWRSSGSSNDELVDNLKRFGVIRKQSVEQAFRSVDRRFFVPQTHLDVAYSDQPLREGHIHISAPHIYGCVVEALDVEPAMSFLNIGSGTGYLSAIVGHMLGPKGSSYGVEIHQETVDHCLASMERHAAAAEGQPELPYTKFLHGNGLQIDASKGEAAIGFDRIYVGASIGNIQLKQLVGLLRMGGILVGPVEDELVKVVRIRQETASPVPTPSGPFRLDELTDEFSKEVISGVLFAPLLKRPSLPTVLKSRVWNTAIHQMYPDSFRMSCKELLLCSTAPTDQTPVRQAPPINIASLLPKPLWLEVLSFTHRDWFENQRTDAAVLRRRVHMLESTVQRTQKEHHETKRKLRVAEREAERYKALASEFEARLEALMDEKQGARWEMLSQAPEDHRVVMVVGPSGIRNHSMEDDDDSSEDDSVSDALSEDSDDDDDDEATSLMDFSVTDETSPTIQARRVSIAEDD